jgi:hypothetical protein
MSRDAHRNNIVRTIVKRLGPRPRIILWLRHHKRRRWMPLSNFAPDERTKMPTAGTNERSIHSLSVKTMGGINAIRARWLPCLVGLTLAGMSHNGAIAGEDADASWSVCAEREVLLMVLVEAHGAFPNTASDILAVENVALMQARDDCDDGNVRDAIAVYDRVITELQLSLTQEDD